MECYRLGTVEKRFAEIIWGHEPISSTELVALAKVELQWKKSTTYTVLRRLCDKGIFRLEQGIVTSLLSRDAFYALQSESFVTETFDGSLPAFLTAFTRRKKLSAREVEALRALIDRYED